MHVPESLAYHKHDTLNARPYEENVFRVYLSILRQLSSVPLTQPIAGTRGDNLVWSGKLTKEIEENMIRKDENIDKPLIKAWLAPDVKSVRVSGLRMM